MVWQREPGIGEPLVPDGPASYLLWPSLSNLLEFFFTPFLFLKRIKETLAPSIPYKSVAETDYLVLCKKMHIIPQWLIYIYIYRFTPNLLIPWNTSWGSSHLTEMFWQSLGCKYSSDVDGTYLCLVSLAPEEPPFSHAPRLFPHAGSSQHPRPFQLLSCPLKRHHCLYLLWRGRGEFFFPQVHFEYKARPEIFFKVFSANDHPDNITSTD